MFKGRIVFPGIITLLSIFFIPILFASAQNSDDQYTGYLTFEISDTPTASNFYSISGYFSNSEGLPLENKSIIIEKQESDKSNTFMISLDTDKTGYYWGNVQLEPPGRSNSEATLCATFDGDIEIDPTDPVCETVILHIIVEERPTSFIEETQNTLELPISSLDNSTNLLILILILVIPIIAGSIFIKKYNSKNKKIKKESTYKKKSKKPTEKRTAEQHYESMYDKFSKQQDSKIFEKPKRKFVGKTYYEVLGLAKNTTPDEIKTRYRELVLKFHPDKEKSTLANEFMLEIKEAYDILSNPKKREQYDTTI